MGCEGPVRPKELPAHCIAHSKLLLRHKAQVIPIWTQYNIFVGLFKPKHKIHHLQFPLYNDCGIRKDRCSRVPFFDDSMRIFGDVYGGEERVVLGRSISKRV